MPPPPERRKTLSARRILIVDDDADIRSNMSDILGDLGYLTSGAANGTEALELMSRNSYEIALLDLNMGGMDGLELYRNLRQQHPETEAFLVSAYTSEGMADEAIRSGILRVFRKPLDMPELIRNIDEALRRLLVLVVDDDKAFASELQETLHQHGYRVGVASSEDDAFEHLHSAAYDTVMLDINSEHVDPVRVLAALRKMNPNARALIVSDSKNNENVIEQLLARGASGVCYKPIDVDGLLARLGRAK